MKVVVFSSQKGGVGKTTLAVNVACEAAGHSRNRVVLIDLDPQGSAQVWGQQRRGPGAAPTLRQVAVRACKPVQLRGLLDELRSTGFTHAVIDLPPVDKKWVKTVFHHADLIILPVRPGFFDMVSGFETWKRVEERPVRWLINGAFDSADQPDSVARVVQTELGRNMQTLHTIVEQAAEWVMSAGAGMGVSEYAPASRAASQARAVWDEVDAFPPIVVKHRYG